MYITMIILSVAMQWYQLYSGWKKCYIITCSEQLSYSTQPKPSHSKLLQPVVQLCFLPLVITIWMVVVADSDVARSIQSTWTPLRPSLTGLMSILDVRGWVESLENVKVVELAILDGDTPLEPPAVTSGMKVVVVPSSRVTVNCHLKNAPGTMHVSSSWSPAWQTGTTPEGEISTTPVDIPGIWILN